MDDSLLLAQTFQECFNNVLATISLLQALGFVIHSTKSIFVPTQKITFLGFEIYRNIEQQKIEALKTSKGNFDINIKQLSSASLSEIKWWHNHIMHAKLPIKQTPDNDYVIYTDASESGWGAHDDINSIGEAVV